MSSLYAVRDTLPCLSIQIISEALAGAWFSSAGCERCLLSSRLSDALVGHQRGNTILEHCRSHDQSQAQQPQHKTSSSTYKTPTHPAHEQASDPELANPSIRGNTVDKRETVCRSSSHWVSTRRLTASIKPDPELQSSYRKQPWKQLQTILSR